MKSGGELTFHFRNIPIRISYAVGLVAVALVWLFWPSWPVRDGFGWPLAFVIAAVKGLVYFASVIVHEAAHAVVASRFGRTVAYIHITAFGGATGYVGSSNEPDQRHSRWLIAAAGPATNALFGGLFLVVQFLIPDSTDSLVGFVIGDIASMGVWVNFVLALFNAIPALPFDGGHVLVEFLQACGLSRAKSLIVGGWAGRIASLLILLALITPSLIHGRQPYSAQTLWATLVVVLLWQGATEGLRAGRELARQAQ